VGISAYVATSALCAASRTVEALVQGLAGGVGIVIAYAADRDLYAGGRLVRY
jgi:MFS transporter, DHA1 family, multidrug resistance protein